MELDCDKTCKAGCIAVATTISKGTYAFVSLGCPKNLVDSERMLGLMALDGYTLVPQPEDADLVIVNTCGFLESARRESLDVIGEMIELKRRGRTKGVVVCGCLAERQREAVLDEVPEIDHLVGVFGRDEIAKVCDRILGDQAEQRTLFRPAPVRALDDRARLRITPRHYAYLKISEGCDRLCTFCAIPSMRGKHVTKPIEQVLTEAEELARDGVRELILVAQDTTYYGTDLYGEVRLAELLRRLEAVEGLDWIRVLYAYPINFTDELVEVLASSGKILPYLDLPLQHVNDVVLRRMQRRVTRAQIEALLRRLREAMPGLVLRTTFIVGFPGETEQQFEELTDFVRQARFERMGCFGYSFEPGTPATRLGGHLDDRVKSERRNRLMEVQQDVAFCWSREQVGRRIEVIVDGPAPEGGDRFIGRSYADAPDIDCLVYVAGEQLRSGQVVPVEVTAADGYDLVAKPVGEPR